MRASPIARFVARVFVWLPLAFLVWYVAAPVLLLPVKLVVALVAHFGFADLVRAVEQHGSSLTFVTTLKPGEARLPGAEITVDVDLLVYSLGLPFFAALVVAAREPGRTQRLALGFLAMLPFIGCGALADFLKHVAITAGPLVASQTNFVAWEREFIAFAYQLGVLILPTVIPAILWVVSHRAFLDRLRLAR